MEEAMEKVPGIFRRWENSTINVTFWHKTGGGSMQVHGWRRIGRTKLLKRRTGDRHWSWNDGHIWFHRERHVSMVLPGADPEGEGKNFKSVKKIFKAFAQTYFGNLVQVPPRSEPSHWARKSFQWTQVLAQVGIWQFVKFWHFGLLVCWHLMDFQQQCSFYAGYAASRLIFPNLWWYGGRNIITL